MNGRNEIEISFSFYVRPCTLKSQAFKGLLLFFVFSRPFNIFWPFVVVEVDVDRKKVFAKKKWETKPRQPGPTSIDKNEDFFPLLLLLSPLFYALSWLAKKLPAFFAFFAFFWATFFRTDDGRDVIKNLLFFDLLNQFKDALGLSLIHKLKRKTNYFVCFLTGVYV